MELQLKMVSGVEFACISKSAPERGRKKTSDRVACKEILGIHRSSDGRKNWALIYVLSSILMMWPDCQISRKATRMRMLLLGSCVDYGWTHSSHSTVGSRHADIMSPEWDLLHNSSHLPAKVVDHVCQGHNRSSKPSPPKYLMGLHGDTRGATEKVEVGPAAVLANA